MNRKIPSWMFGCLFLTSALFSGCGKDKTKILVTSDPQKNTPEIETKVNILSSLPIREESVDLVKNQSLGTFRNTYYYLKEEAPYASKPKDAEIRDVRGNVIAKVNSTFKRLLDIEGSGLLISGLVVNYAKKIGDEIRYMPTIHPWGRGVGNCPLKPFRSIAVDEKRIPFGAVIRINEMIGMPLPNGALHDGYFVTSDTGGAIREDRIDIFTGRESWGNTLSNYNIKHMQALTLSLIATPNEKTCALKAAQ